ncbi:MAG: aminoglycoside phosphotransferase family protein [Dongiaceae bacterium]
MTAAASDAASALFDRYLERWDLLADGDPIVTHSSRLLPVRRRGIPAMLKIAIEAEEKFGGLLMSWWDGEGAARVLAYDEGALLLERAEGTRSLAAMARDRRDDETTRILCDVAARLHAPRGKPWPDLIPLEPWFGALLPMAALQGGLLAESAALACELLDAPREIGVLHGDIHHDNVLDFGARGWLAIDPKRLVGERGFDYANLFCNPDRAVATEPALFERRIAIVVAHGGLERIRLLQWIVAWCGLSAAWFLGNDMTEDAETDFAVARLALAALAR